ncbi:uncharacterized protein METZ01_LOCUS234111 [marine metagenome]|jgi:GDP-L-fucose synthase|uniref:NAD-dependent epimerase/dehydratase domain-containing protein n=1 Tax=marine metagenome TaxID=408172 RepID=A0A382H2U8_9ZZZZ
MIGQALVELLYDTTPDNIMVADLPNVDLRDRKDCKAVCEDQDVVFHLAGIKGSPQRCMEAPATFSVPMIQFNANMVEAAYNADVDWFLYTSSVGVYHPAEVFVENDVWKTFPSENDWYAGWAKRVGELNVQAYMKEYDWNKCSIVRPANVYGPNDNFGQYSMVIPSLIKKAHENEVLEVWGDGSPVRDFVYSEDVARAMKFVVENKITEPVNIGSGTGTTIKEIADIIANYFEKEIKWDITKPMGDMKRIMSTDRLESYGFKLKYDLKEGIEKTIEWYLNL